MIREMKIDMASLTETITPKNLSEFSDNIKALNANIEPLTTSIMELNTITLKSIKNALSTPKTPRTNPKHNENSNENENLNTKQRKRTFAEVTGNQYDGSTPKQPRMKDIQLESKIGTRLTQQNIIQPGTPRTMRDGLKTSLESIYATGFNPATTPEMVLEYLKSIGVQDELIRCNLLLPKGKETEGLTFVSFRIAVPQNLVSTVSNTENWPSFIKLREFVNKPRPKREIPLLKPINSNDVTNQEKEKDEPEENKIGTPKKTNENEIDTPKLQRDQATKNNDAETMQETAFNMTQSMNVDTRVPASLNDTHPEEK